MAIDIDKVLKQKQILEAKLSRSGNGATGIKFWRPEDGENIIRILPPWTTEGPFSGQFWREMYQHWNVSTEQKGPVMCPAKTPGLDASCPVCEFVDELRADKSNPEGQILAKDLRVKLVYLLNIIVTDDPTYTAKDMAEWKKSRPDTEVPFAVGATKIQFYACPTTIFEQILNLISRNKSDITDLSSGRDLTVTKFPNKKEPKLTRYQVTPSFETSEVKGFTQETKIPALDTVGYVMKYDDMALLLSQGPAGSFAALPSPKTSSKAPKADEPEDLMERMKRELNS